MDAKTLYYLLEPHLTALQPREKQTLSKMITGERNAETTSKRRKVLSLKAAKKKLRLFRHREMIRESM